MIRNPRYLVLNGDQFSPKAKGYVVTNEHIPVLAEEALQTAVNNDKIIALNLSENLGYIEFDPCETLGSEDVAKTWLAENMWRLERLQTIVVRSRRFGFHVWFIA